MAGKAVGLLLRVVTLVLACQVMATAALAGHGQPRGTTASLSGRVIDRSGQPLAGVMLVLVGPNQFPKQHTMLSDQNGSYQIDGLAAGRYRLTVGHLEQKREARELSLAQGESQRLDIQLSGITPRHSGPN